MKTFERNVLFGKLSSLMLLVLMALCVSLPIQADELLSSTSLAGTTADGELQWDERGDLVIVPEVRRFVDYFLSARGEVDDNALRGAAERALVDRLPARAAKQGLEIFDLYLRYVDEAPSVLGDGPSKAMQEATRIPGVYEQMTELRVEVFGEDRARALFGADLDREAATLRLQSKLLSSGESDARIAARRTWEASLSSEEIQARSEALGPVNLREEVEKLRATGANPDAIWSARAQAYGPEAANRLARLDQERADWQRRVEIFRAQRVSIERSKLGPAQKRQAVDGLLAESFSTTEQKRIRALDRIQP